MTAPLNHCWTCADLRCREIQRRSCDLKTAGCGEWKMEAHALDLYREKIKLVYVDEVTVYQETVKHA